MLPDAILSAHVAESIRPVVENSSSVFGIIGYAVTCCLWFLGTIFCPRVALIFAFYYLGHPVLAILSFLSVCLMPDNDCDCNKEVRSGK